MRATRVHNLATTVWMASMVPRAHKEASVYWWLEGGRNVVGFGRLP